MSPMVHGDLFQFENTTEPELTVREYYAELIRSLLSVVGFASGETECIPDNFWFRNEPSRKFSLLKMSDDGQSG